MPTCDNISQHSFKTTEINAPCVFEVVRHPLDARVPQLWVDTLQVTQTLAIEFYVRKRQWELSSLESYKRKQYYNLCTKKNATPLAEVRKVIDSMVGLNEKWFKVRNPTQSTTDINLLLTEAFTDTL